jgi:hypothetical protein
LHSPRPQSLPVKPGVQKQVPSLHSPLALQLLVHPELTGRISNPFLKALCGLVLHKPAVMQMPA